jgi:hypothetical protein
VEVQQMVVLQQQMDLRLQYQEVDLLQYRLLVVVKVVLLIVVHLLVVQAVVVQQTLRLVKQAELVQQMKDTLVELVVGTERIVLLQVVVEVTR